MGTGDRTIEGVDTAVDSLGPKSKRQGCVGVKKSAGAINNRKIIFLRDPVLLRGITNGSFMADAMSLQPGIK